MTSLSVATNDPDHSAHAPVQHKQEMDHQDRHDPGREEAIFEQVEHHTTGINRLRPFDGMDIDDDPTTTGHDEHCHHHHSSSGRPHRQRSWWKRLMDLKSPSFPRDKAARMGLLGDGIQVVDHDDREGYARRLSESANEPYHARHRKSRQRRRISRYLFGASFGGALLLIFILWFDLIASLIHPLVVRLDLDHTMNLWGKKGSPTEDLAWYPTDYTQGIEPVQCHSHNDYWRKIPFYSALRVGCVSVEADVWLRGGGDSSDEEELLVGHNEASLQPHRTFRSLYVDPIKDVLERQNPSTDFYQGTNHGVFDTNPHQTLVLLVDLKTAGKETFHAAMKQLEPLRERGWLSYVEDEVLHPGPVTVVMSGNAPFDVLMAEGNRRDAFFDAPLDLMYEPAPAGDEEGDASEGESSLTRRATDPARLTIKDQGQGKSGITADTDFSSLNSYYASVSFHKVMGELARGAFSERQLDLLRGQIRGAHRRGLKVRYWATPAWPVALRNHVWTVLVREGADVLSADDIEAASRGAWGGGESAGGSVGARLAVFARNVAVTGFHGVKGWLRG